MVLKIISGGQTGADRAALDFALSHRIPHGGWIPKGRRAEDGKIPAEYDLRETASRRYAVRTERNVLDSDGTLIVSQGDLTGGSALTESLAEAHKKPYIHIDLNRLSPQEAGRTVRRWILRHRPVVLNVAGQRAGKNPRIYRATLDLLEAADLFDGRKMMAKKVLVLLGSPRKKGNSAILAGQVARGAKAAKARVETVYVQDYRIAPCMACYACQKKNSRGCAIRDDMQALYPKLVEADAWVIASPVYWFTVSAQTKLWMDRCFALPAYGREPFKGKRIAVAMTYGGDDPFDSGCVNALRAFQDAFAYKESQIVGMVYGSAYEAGEIKGNGKVMQEAFDLGKRLASP